MTPEERAVKALSDPMGTLVPEKSFDWIAERIAAAIRAAVESEREACALAADSIANDYWDMFKGRGKHAPNNPMRADPYADGVSHGAEECAALIRHRGDA